MTTYKFKAQKPGGEIYEASREATDKFALYRDVKAETGDTVILTEESKTNNISPLFKIKDIFSRISIRDKILLARNLGTMLQAGLSLSRALSVIDRQSKKKGLKKVIGKIIEAVSGGKSFSDSLRDFPRTFAPLFVSMVKAGEESGSLPDSLRTVSDQMNNSYMLQKKIRGAMIYPSLIITVMIAIGILMLIYVVPTLTAVFKDMKVDLPWNTQLIIVLSENMKDHFIIFILGLFSVAGAAYMFKRSASGGRIIDTILLKLPVIGQIIREANSARTARTLSSLLSAGVDVVQSIEITSDVVQNHHFKSVLTRAKERIKTGEPMTAVFTEHVDLYPVFFGEMVSIGEETGKLGEMLMNVATYYENEVDQKTKDLSTIIEPILMIVIGCAVAFFAISILMPMYSLSSSI